MGVDALEPAAKPSLVLTKAIPPLGDPPGKATADHWRPPSVVRKSNAGYAPASPYMASGSAKPNCLLTKYRAEVDQYQSAPPAWAACAEIDGRWSVTGTSCYEARLSAFSTRSGPRVPRPAATTSPPIVPTQWSTMSLPCQTFAQLAPSSVVRSISLVAPVA